MRQSPFPTAYGGGNLCEKTWQRSRIATPSSHRKYEQSVWANRPLTLLGGITLTGALVFHPPLAAPSTLMKRGVERRGGYVDLLLPRHSLKSSAMRLICFRLTGLSRWFL